MEFRVASFAALPWPRKPQELFMNEETLNLSIRKFLKMGRRALAARD
jgi:hypothetical protein